MARFELTELHDPRHLQALIFESKVLESDLAIISMHGPGIVGFEVESLIARHVVNPGVDGFKDPNKFILDSLFRDLVFLLQDVKELVPACLEVVSKLSILVL